MRRLLPTIDKVHAHCDVPCGIYDPSEAQFAALSVARFLQQIDGLITDTMSTSDTLILSRMVQQKEEHAISVKRAICVIWGDYFKSTHVETHPHIHELSHSIMQAASKCKQQLSYENGVTLVDLVNQFAAVFWDTRAIATQYVRTPYEPHLPLLVPVLPVIESA
jgi:nickel superoxide dismutase